MEPHEGHHEHEREQGAEPARRNWPLRIAKWIGFTLLGIVLLVGALLLGLNTGPGKRFIADQIAGFEFENGMQIEIGRIEGSIYSEMVLHDLAIADPRGAFLTSPEIAVDWRPFAFLDNHVDIRSAIAERMTLLRLPEFRETPETDDPLLPDLDIDIGRLRIDRFVAEAPVSGERRVARLAGEAHISDGRAQMALNGAVLGETGGDRLALVLDAVPEAQQLDIELKVRAPQGGLILALAGFDQPLAIDLDGRGDWQAWNGRLNANMAGSEFARLDIAARDGTFMVRGPTRIARLFEGQTAALLGPVTTVDLTATPEERRVALDGRIASDAFRLTTNGTVDLGESTFDDLRVGFVLPRPAALAEGLQGSGLRGQLALNGAFTAPVVGYTINANRLAFNDTGLNGLTATGEVRIDPDRILVPLDARVDRITGLDEVAGGSLTNVRLNGDLAIEGTRILSDNLRIRSNRIDAGLIIAADTSTGLYTGAVDGRIDDYRLAGVGVFDIGTDIDLETVGDSFALAGRVTVRTRRLENEGVRDFLGGQAVAGANIRYGGEGIARFSNLQLTSPLVRITNGSGFYSPDGRLALNADARTEQYGAVGVRVSGTLANLDASVTAERPDLGIGLANLDARISSEGAGYRLRGTADTDYGALTADVSVIAGDQLAFDINSANLGGVDFNGSLRQTAAGPFAGRLNARGQGIGGVVRLGAEGQYQSAAFNLAARNASLPGPVGLQIGGGRIDGRVILYDTPQIVAEAQLARARIGNLYLNAARATVDYQGGTGSARVLAEGESGVPFRIAANARMTPQLWRVALRGRARGQEFATVTPARIVPGEPYRLLPTTIDVGPGDIRLAGTYGANRLKLQSRVDRLDLELANAFVADLGLGGTASGSIDFVQTGNAFPRADARLRIDDFTRTTAVSVSQPVDVNFIGKLLPDGGEARAVIRRRGSVIGRMVASLTPLPPGSGSWTTRLLSAPLGGGIRYNGPADTLFSLAGQPDQRLSGPIGIAADFSGRVSDPELTGIVRANRLVYENQTFGTRLSDMEIRARFQGNRLQIERLQAAAGNGTVRATGFVSLSAETGYPMNVAIDLDNARLADGDDLSARADGSLRLTKAAGRNALLSGQLRLPETRYTLVRSDAAEVPALTGVRFKPPVGPARITGDEPAETVPGAFAALALDIDLAAEDELYVSGMGLESEWEADLNITGTSDAPVMSGTVDLIRGTLGFAGRSFELEQGAIAFTGGREINPTIRIVAIEDIEDVTVAVNVEGRALDPQIEFTSTPGLPQDEIVSRILFGSSVQNLSALQAVQLAASLNTLSSGGGGGGLNPLGTLRSATGIDRLRILGPDEAQGRGTAVAAGQYLTDDVYIELVTDARGFTATQLEIALTPALSILTTAGGANGTDVNVLYRKNY